jgi:hypothetical protein
VITGVAVEKLAPEICDEKRSRQEALQTIFCDNLDIFYLRISGYFKKKKLFQQPQDLSISIHIPYTRGYLAESG